ncbi:E3 ubiquitin-protein ligase TRIM7-like [Heteronotia binoei]|uniref:E3 ubiquitin-protein ligase TRIM7-like n=1 Tax=Heteronotia binoei TaxID=13085 RepID=UPI0029310EBA|nr:E3 ubiquitin-protein ligase TRIM7-like [Heteronotia binoei]XP_060094994.1 E3 ubiquitin-protein ligase TRIM7-like [Heteronotia binoei]
MEPQGPLKELCEEASCSICLDYFTDPVMIAECGHNFCRACLTRSWGESSGAAEPSCPQCRGKAQPSSLRPNQQLANVVAIAKKFTLQERKDAAGANGPLCQKHQELLRFSCQDDEAPFCMVCGISQELREAVGAAGKGRVCQKHQEPLKLFCKDDEALICVVCDRSKEHREHETLPLEEASQEYKDQFRNCLEILEKERERIVAYKGDIERESQDLLKQTQGEKQEAVAKFRQLHVFLEEQEKLLLAQMEEVEMEVAKKRDQHVAELSEALSSLESLIREMEEKCQQPASDLLQDARSTLQKYEEKESFENPVDFPLALKWHIWYFSHFNPPLEVIKRQFKDTLDSGLHLQKANVSLDPNTAHKRLILSEGQKSVRRGEKAQALPTSPERFENYSAVLGCEGFTGGCHFWEVLVGNEERWAVGVARKSVRRKESFIFSPEEGIWAMGKESGMHSAFIKECDFPLTVTGELKRIRVCLNYAGGRVAFFDADRAALLYEFSGASFFGETLLPFFWVYGKAHLKISS